jgi:NADH-quinone oxidoreductase subunit J
MRLYEVLFYMIAAVTLTATAMAVTRRHLIHAVIYLVASFFGTAMLFYLFGAPILAALEIIIYAGAIMVLFLFIIMMLRSERTGEHFFPLRQWLPAALMAGVYLAVGGILVGSDVDSGTLLTTAVASPRAFGRFLFERHLLSIEIVSLLLLVALVGALYLGKSAKATGDEEKGELP